MFIFSVALAIIVAHILSLALPYVVVLAPTYWAAFSVALFGVGGGMLIVGGMLGTVFSRVRIYGSEANIKFRERNPADEVEEKKSGRGMTLLIAGFIVFVEAVLLATMLL